MTKAIIERSCLRVLKERLNHRGPGLNSFVKCCCILILLSDTFLMFEEHVINMDWLEREIVMEEELERGREEKRKGDEQTKREEQFSLLS